MTEKKKIYDEILMTKTEKIDFEQTRIFKYSIYQ